MPPRSTKTPKLVMLVTSPARRSPGWSEASRLARQPGPACAARSEKTMRPRSGSNSMILTHMGEPTRRSMRSCRSSSEVNAGNPMTCEAGTNPRNPSASTSRPPRLQPTARTSAIPSCSYSSRARDQSNGAAAQRSAGAADRPRGEYPRCSSCMTEAHQASSCDAAPPVSHSTESPAGTDTFSLAMTVTSLDDGGAAEGSEAPAGREWRCANRRRRSRSRGRATAAPFR